MVIIKTPAKIPWSGCTSSSNKHMFTNFTARQRTVSDCPVSALTGSRARIADLILYFTLKLCKNVIREHFKTM
jgi:hypothetical protein